ncbi:hypothetical protein, partial [Vibrio sp. PNB22_4_1]
MTIVRGILTTTAALSLFGCGNDSNDKPTPVAPPAAPEISVEGYTNAVKLDLTKLVNQSGQTLVNAIEDQLNASLPNGSKEFKVHSTENWDNSNLAVIEHEGDFVLHTNIDAYAHGLPSKGVNNGFSFIVELPNGLVREATLAYYYKLGTPIGNKKDNNSPDYIFLPGFTSGNPSFTPNVSLDGEGFTYKFSTDRYNYISVRGKDSSNSKFTNAVLKNDEQKLSSYADSWNLIQQHYSSNDFTESEANANGSMSINYNGYNATTDKGDINQRSFINATHPYHLSALFEVYRHYLSGSDDESSLLQQSVLLKDLTFAWNDDEVRLPEEPEADLSGYSNAVQLDLSSLDGKSGLELIEEFEKQLNSTLTTRSSQFKVIPNESWKNQQLTVVKDNDEFVLQTTIDAQAYGLPNADINNGFSFLISLPNGLVREATMAYHYKVGAPIGYNDASKTPDYLFLPGFTSGNPSFTPNVSLDGEGFTYKFSTDRYNYLSVRGKDSTDATFANSVLMQGEDKLGISANTWNLVQQHLTANDFTGNTANANGSVTMAYNNSTITPIKGAIEKRILANATHPYHLSALFEVNRHYLYPGNGSDVPADSVESLKQQTIQLKNITFAWNEEEVALPEEPQADLSGYAHSATLDLSQLNGQSGSALLQAIETQLNATLPAGAEAFNVRPNDSWANQQLSVVEHNGEFVLQTTIDAQAYGLPNADINNGFSFLIELPNGLVREATMAYHYKVGTPIGYSNDSQSPDYLFLPGFTSGNPSFTPNVSLDGEGFTYKFSTDRYNYLSVRGKDSTDATFANSVLMQGEDKLGISANTWNLVQQHLTANDFTGNTANANGSVTMAYNNSTITPIKGAIEKRILANATHPYHLSALFEVNRHYLYPGNGSDVPADSVESLKQQTIQLKNITFAWNEEEVALPEEPQADLSGYAHSATLDLSQLNGQSGSALLQAIETQLNATLPAGA